MPRLPGGKRLFVSIHRIPIQVVDAWIATALAACPRLGLRRRDWRRIVDAISFGHYRIPSRNDSGKR